MGGEREGALLQYLYNCHIRCLDVDKNQTYEKLQQDTEPVESDWIGRES